MTWEHVTGTHTAKTVGFCFTSCQFQSCPTTRSCWTPAIWRLPKCLQFCATFFSKTLNVFPSRKLYDTSSEYTSDYRSSKLKKSWIFNFVYMSNKKLLDTVKMLEDTKIFCCKKNKYLLPNFFFWLFTFLRVQKHPREPLVGLRTRHRYSQSKKRRFLFHIVPISELSNKKKLVDTGVLTVTKVPTFLCNLFFKNSKRFSV